VDDDREQARMAARYAAALYLPIVIPLDPTIQVEPDLIEQLRTHVNHQEFDAASQLISNDLLDRFAISGNANDIIQQCEALFAAGANRVEFGTPHGLKPEYGIHLLGEKVIPALQHLLR
jgi:5,10-methylenetetrahydromethanopterin reductase